MNRADVRKLLDRLVESEEDQIFANVLGDMTGTGEPPASAAARMRLGFEKTARLREAAEPLLNEFDE